MVISWVKRFIGAESEDRGIEHVIDPERSSVSDLIDCGGIEEACFALRRYSAGVSGAIEKRYSYQFLNELKRIMSLKDGAEIVPTSVSCYQEVHMEYEYPRVAAKFVFDRFSLMEDALEQYPSGSQVVIMDYINKRLANLEAKRKMRNDFREKILAAFFEIIREKAVPFKIYEADLRGGDDRLDVLRAIFTRECMSEVDFDVYCGPTELENYIEIKRVLNNLDILSASRIAIKP